ncbi:hypothetical protein N7493_001080 [Penicillium malachiteum]|uniref:Uncharacterized protein n=1 Tax=Penicillium malachiteum TaxID=1324776 RepID=A0AAD6MZH6_9EURO|nr:hypothetical protein N7493_001080 [Penicillium malachiteum]
MSFQDLPPELLLMVMADLEFVVDRNSFVKTNRSCYSVLNRELYLSSISELDFYGILWAAKKGELRTLQYFLHAAKRGFHMALESSDIQWRPIWEVWPSWGARFECDPLQNIPVIIYERGLGKYGSGHIPIICVYRDALLDATKHGHVEAVKFPLEWMRVFFHSIFTKTFNKLLLLNSAEYDIWLFKSTYDTFYRV